MPISRSNTRLFREPQRYELQKSGDKANLKNMGCRMSLKLHFLCSRRISVILLRQMGKNKISFKILFECLRYSVVINNIFDTLILDSRFLDLIKSALN